MTLGHLLIATRYIQNDERIVFEISFPTFASAARESYATRSELELAKLLDYSVCSPSLSLRPLFLYSNCATMKTQKEEMEDDLAAEEENKLINEVCSRVLSLGICTQSQNSGIQDLVRCLSKCECCAHHSAR
jgi:hypothetical protein